MLIHLSLSLSLSLMLNSLLAFFNRSLDDMLKLGIPNNATKIIYRDELSNKKPFSRKQKSGCYSENSEPLLLKREEEDQGKLFTAVDQKEAVIRVKVKMTRQEAARLLSKCKNGGVLDFKDVSHELTRIPMDRIHIESPGRTSCGSGLVLKSIPEEF